MTNENVDITANFHGGNKESVAAHDSIRPTKAQVRARVLSIIRSGGEAGATSDEAESWTGLSHQSCSARFTELKADGLIEPAGRRLTRSGRGAMAWRLRER